MNNAFYKSVKLCIHMSVRIRIIANVHKQNNFPYTVANNMCQHRSSIMLSTIYLYIYIYIVAHTVAHTVINDTNKRLP